MGVRHRSGDASLAAGPSLPQAPEKATGNWQIALAYLGIVWTFAAFGEEIAYRGYLLTRAADVGGRTPFAWWISVIIVSVLFGYGHYYKAQPESSIQASRD